jgi:cob(I)alamin adenosyltransferase
VASFLHHARTVCRRAERLCVSLSKHEEVSEVGLKYLNRFSDLMFVLARVANDRMGCPEIYWESVK